MFTRLHPAWLALGGSVLLLAGLCTALYWDPFAAEEPIGHEPLEVWCAEAHATADGGDGAGLEREVGQHVTLHFGASQTILTNLQITRQGDLFLPADDNFIELARRKDAVAEVLPLARLTAVAVTRPGYNKRLQSWSDFVAADHSLGLGNQSTAIGKLTRRRLTDLGLWDSVERPSQPTSKA